MNLGTSAGVDIIKATMRLKSIRGEKDSELVSESER